NSSGMWYNGSINPTYNTSIYPWGAGNITMTITNLPSNVYSFFLYGHEGNEVANSRFNFYRDGTLLGYMGTTTWGQDWNSTNWECGQQYVIFKNIAVTNQIIKIEIPPGGDGYPYVNGMQIIESASVPAPQLAISNLININLGNPI